MYSCQCRYCSHGSASAVRNRNVKTKKRRQTNNNRSRQSGMSSSLKRNSSTALGNNHDSTADSSTSSSQAVPKKKRIKLDDSSKNKSLTPLDFVELEKGDTMTLHRLNCVTFSVHKRPYFFPVSFYRDLFKSGSFSGIVYYYTQRVGGCYCRLKPDDPTTLVIMCIGTLPSLRRKGIALRMMNEILKFAQNSKHSPKIIELNVHISNIAAINLYKKYDFKIVETVNNYYAQAEYDSRDAYLMRRSLTD